MSYITTYTGKHFDPIQPEPGLFDLTDISHALSLLCRGNGHMKHFYSVAQHSIACAEEAKARGYSARVQLGCLLHDASECYMSDVPTPFKKKLPEYEMQEDRLLRMIFEKYLGSDLTKEELDLVKEIDHTMLLYDLKELLGEMTDEEMPKLHMELDYMVQPFREVEEEFLRIFTLYSRK